MQVHLELNLKTLKLPTILRSYQKISEAAVKEGLTCEQYLYRLTGVEIEKRREKKNQCTHPTCKVPTQEVAQ